MKEIFEYFFVNHPYNPKRRFMAVFMWRYYSQYVRTISTYVATRRQNLSFKFIRRLHNQIFMFLFIKIFESSLTRQATI